MFVESDRCCLNLSRGRQARLEYDFTARLVLHVELDRFLDVLEPELRVDLSLELVLVHLLHVIDHSLVPFLGFGADVGHQKKGFNGLSLAKEVD